jgi:hypothetical protein
MRPAVARAAVALALAAVLSVQAQPAPPPLSEAGQPPAAPVPPAEAGEETKAPASGQQAQGPTGEKARARSALPDLLQTRIEQVRRGNRVTEVRVTGPAGDVRYTMDNPPPATAQPLRESGSGLSTPSFLRIEF